MIWNSSRGPPSINTSLSHRICKYLSNSRVLRRKRVVSSCQRWRFERGVQRIAARLCPKIKLCMQLMLSTIASTGQSYPLWYEVGAISNRSFDRLLTLEVASRAMRDLLGRHLTSPRLCTPRLQGLHGTASTCMTSCNNTSMIRGRKKTLKWSSKNLTTQTSPCSS